MCKMRVRSSCDIKMFDPKTPASLTGVRAPYWCDWKLRANAHSQMMNAARIHDKQKLKSFWEQRIVQHHEQMDEEDSRMRSSSLARFMQKHDVCAASNIHNQTLCFHVCAVSSFAVFCMSFASSSSP
ncbi:uncharacterized protein V6R79_024147 [Siganus canaliculatus]